MNKTLRDFGISGNQDGSVFMYVMHTKKAQVSIGTAVRKNYQQQQQDLARNSMRKINQQLRVCVHACRKLLLC